MMSRSLMQDDVTLTNTGTGTGTNTSWTEDNISVYQSNNVTIARGVIDGNNSPSVRALPACSLFLAVFHTSCVILWLLFPLATSTYLTFTFLRLPIAFKPSLYHNPKTLYRI